MTMLYVCVSIREPGLHCQRLYYAGFPHVPNTNHPGYEKVFDENWCLGNQLRRTIVQVSVSVNCRSVNLVSLLLCDVFSASCR